jgi:hypothetical protein
MSYIAGIKDNAIPRSHRGICPGCSLADSEKEEKENLKKDYM